MSRRFEKLEITNWNSTKECGYMKKVARWIVTIITVSAVIVAVNLLIEGIPLSGIPDAEQIEKVVIVHKDSPDTIREYTDE